MCIRDSVYASAVLNYNHEKITKLFYDLEEYKMPSYSWIYKTGEAEQFLMAEYAGAVSYTHRDVYKRQE